MPKSRIVELATEIEKQCHLLPFQSQQREQMEQLYNIIKHMEDLNLPNNGFTHYIIGVEGE